MVLLSYLSQKVNTKSCSGFFLISIQRLQDSRLDRYFAFFLRLAYKPCIELEVLSNKPIGCLSDGPTLIFRKKSIQKVVVVFLEKKRDIVDTCFHALRVTVHNMTKQSCFPNTWAGEKRQQQQLHCLFNSCQVHG
jgi:hypothetical protein